MRASEGTPSGRSSTEICVKEELQRFGHVQARGALARERVCSSPLPCKGDPCGAHWSLPFYRGAYVDIVLARQPWHRRAAHVLNVIE